MVNLEYYRVFYHVAKSGSITQAAQALYISQPAVSQAIKNLETALGGALFLRTPKGVRLTPEGEVLYSYVARGYETLLQAEAKYRELYALEAGTIRIGASDMTLQFYLLPHLEAFHRQYPGIKIHVSNGPTPETLAALRAGHIDFAAVSAPVEPEEDWEVTPVREIRDAFVAGPRFSALRDRVIGFDELARLPMICLEPNTSSRRYMDAFLRENGAALNPEFELATSELIVQFAARGLGIGCVMEDFAARHLAEGSLFALTLCRIVPPRHICIAQNRRAPISPAGAKLLRLLLP